jgi:hypothetical protein
MIPNDHPSMNKIYNKNCLKIFQRKIKLETFSLVQNSFEMSKNDFFDGKPKFQIKRLEKFENDLFASFSQEKIKKPKKMKNKFKPTNIILKSKTSFKSEKSMDSSIPNHSQELNYEM